MNSSFSLINTKRFLMVLVVAYFIFPAAASHFVFEAQFYIYSPSQATGDLYSALTGIFMVLWVNLLIPNTSLRYSRLVDEIATSRIFQSLYIVFFIYIILLGCYGLMLRVGGASRDELLGGMDNFLLPGMSYLLLSAAVVSVAAHSNARLFAMVIGCVVVDMIFNGKIFSFLAAGMIFFRMDYVDVSAKARNRIWALVLLMGPLLLFVIGLSRISLTGASLELDLLAVLYTFASEFLGVEASTGWAIDYYNSGQSASLLLFAASLQDSYIDQVGHGLALSPVAFFVGNFGEYGVLWLSVSMLALAFFARATRPAFTWVIFLIIALNFQHFMRHGFNVFLVKVVTQAGFFYIVAELAGSRTLRSALAK